MAAKDYQPAVWLKLTVGVAFILVCIAVLPWFLEWIGIKPADGAGTFGDQYGMLNAMFSGLAFVGLILAIFLQKQELRYQREELEATREELKGQREQMTLQNENLRQQRFENTFFEMLKLHNEIVQSFFLRVPHREPVSGRSCFSEWTLQLARVSRDFGFDTPENIYREFYNDNQALFAHYFRNLYTVLSFIDGGSIQNPSLYASLVRAQLSTHELILLFYHGLSEVGAPFKPLLEKFSILEGIRADHLAKSEHLNLYEPIAYNPPRD